MSENPPQVRSGKSPVADECKLNLSQSENTLDGQKNSRHNPLGKSWSSKEFHSKDKSVSSVDVDLAKSLTKLNVADSMDSEGAVGGGNLLRARDSLDNLLKDEQTMPKASILERSILRMKRAQIPGSPKSSPQLRESWKPTSSRQIFWDPYERQGKKNRKDIKRKNKHKSPQIEMRNDEGPDGSMLEDDNMQGCRFYAKNSKSVVFTNEVLVVYYNNDDVLGEEKEPLKKEMEQQTRNKEMRRIRNKTQDKYNLCLF